MIKGKVQSILINEDHGIEIDNSSAITTLYSAKEAKLSLSCRLKLWIKDYIFAIIVVSTLTIYLASVLKSCLHKRRVGKVSRDIYNEVKQNLSTNENGLTQTDILRMFLRAPKTSAGDTVPRDQQTFKQQVWPQLEALRQSDRQRVTESECLQFGRSERRWNMD